MKEVNGCLFCRCFQLNTEERMAANAVVANPEATDDDRRLGAWVQGFVQKHRDGVVVYEAFVLKLNKHALSEMVSMGEKLEKVVKAYEQNKAR